MAHDNDKHAELKAQYRQDEKWMAEPWTAWQSRAPLISKNWVNCTHQPFWGLDGLDYRRRPDAPERCCRLCKYNQSATGFGVVCRHPDNKQGFWLWGINTSIESPEWCPLDAKPEQCDKKLPLQEAMATVHEKLMKLTKEEFDVELEKYTDGDIAKIILDSGMFDANDNKCSTCRHTYEPKPRTIRFDAELPEPVTTNEVVYSCKPTLKFTVTLHSNAEAEAWLKWWQEQVTK